MEFQIGPYDPCPCGSGKKYKFCCVEANKQKRHGKYPCGTVAYYGPDEKTPTKIAAGVIMHEGAEPIMQRWVSTEILTDSKIAREVMAFFAKHGVKNVITTDGVLGCPHEEGIDYPDGGDCPFCPFWSAGRAIRALDGADDGELDDDDEDDDDEQLDPEAEWEESQRKHDAFNRMQALIEGVEDSGEVLERMFEHMRSSLQLPLVVTGSEDFQWEEPYVFGGFPRREYKQLKRTQPSFEDEFEILEIRRGEVSQWMLFDDDIAARVRRLSDGKLFTLGLSELEAVDDTAPGAQLLHDYGVWFINWRAGAN